MGLGWLYRKPYGAALYGKMNIRSLGLIAGAEPATEKKWHVIGEQVSSIILKQGWKLVYCGMGSGLAGQVARQVIAEGNKVHAILVKGKEPPDVPPGVQKLIVTDFHNRTRKLFKLSDALLILPGGIGTLMELTQIAAFRGVGLLKKHVVVYDPDGWFDPIMVFYKEAYKQRISRIPKKYMFRKVKTLSQLRFHLSRWYSC